jgi:hypothetical protein
VVAAVVVTDLLAQILYPTPNVHTSGHAGIIRTQAPAPKRSSIATVGKGLNSPCTERSAPFAPQAVTETL